MEDENEPGEQADLLSEMSDIAAVRLLLADFHEDLPSRVARLRYLNELGANLGSADTMLFGGITSYYAWMEARSSFVHGNSVATILLCQSLIENLLGAVLYAAGFDDLPSRIQFTDTLDRCSEIGLVTDQELDELKRLASLRNPLTHFRDITTSTISHAGR
jgi:hypothetical protein